MECTGISCTSFLSASLPYLFFFLEPWVFTVYLQTYFLVSHESYLLEASHTAQLPPWEVIIYLFSCFLFW